MNSMFVSKQEMWTSSACSLSHTKSALLCCQWRIMQQVLRLQWKGGLGLGTHSISNGDISLALFSEKRSMLKGGYWQYRPKEGCILVTPQRTGRTSSHKNE